MNGFCLKAMKALTVDFHLVLVWCIQDHVIVIMIEVTLQQVATNSFCVPILIVLEA